MLVTACLDRHTDEIEVCYLPSYYTDLNPDEYLNNELKGGIRNAAPTSKQVVLEKLVKSHLRMLQNGRTGWQIIFKHSSISYAA